jgi:hypothetical protein
MNKSPLTLPQSFHQLPKLRKLYLRGSELVSQTPFEEISTLVEIDLSPSHVKAMNDAVRSSIPLQISLVSFDTFKEILINFMKRKMKHKYIIDLHTVLQKWPHKKMKTA